MIKGYYQDDKRNKEILIVDEKKMDIDKIISFLT